MKLRHAILGLLSHGPQSGYDLSRAFAGSVVNFWHADQSQVYRTLDRLEDDGAGTVVVTVPARAEAGRQIHLVVEGTDTGSPALTRYQRVVLTVV